MKFAIFVIIHIILLINIFYGLNIRSGLASGEPPLLNLNVTYELPSRDLDEQRKFTMEHLNYIKKVKRLQQKFNDDLEMLKMILNVQNIQIQKLNEVVILNRELALQVANK
jgi:hypothetical protein